MTLSPDVSKVILANLKPHAQGLRHSTLTGILCLPEDRLKAHLDALVKDKAIKLEGKGAHARYTLAAAS